jgi:hypothetical protein
MTTTNLGLSTFNTASGSATTFLTFRLDLADASSNMSKIDNFAGDTTGSINVLKTNVIFNTPASYISSNYYEATVTGITSYFAGLSIMFTPNVTNDGYVTLNINGLGIKYLMKTNIDGVASSFASGNLQKNRKYLFTFDGTYFMLGGALVADQVTIDGTIGNLVMISGSNVLVDSGVTLYGTSGSQILGFYGVSPIPRQTIFGSTTGSEANSNLLIALENLGLIINSTT